MALPNEPITRQEMYLSNIAGQNTALPDAPITREEMYLDYIAKNGGTGEGDMKKSIYDSDNAVATAGGIKMFVNQKIGTLPQRVGSLETTAGVLEGEVASIEDTLDNLGTASTKNSTSVVTESSDLVESGAVYTALQSKVDNTVIGTVEDGTSPTKAYAVGEHFIRNGKFCTCTVAVTTSSTWVEGSNYISGAVGDIVYIPLSTGTKNVPASGSVIHDFSASDIPFVNYDILNVSIRAEGAGAYTYCTTQWVYTTSYPLRIIIYNSDTSQARDFSATAYLTLRVK